MITKTITRTKPYLCTLCGGTGIDPRAFLSATAAPQCPSCNGTGILQIGEVETWYGPLDIDKPAEEG